ncbi:transposase, partial [Candidatus Peregrinibacteria bacterium]|nr:transposase [Candidatus Peregrinibacteria bacterium]
AANTIKANEGKVLNYFYTRSTNASAESFNAKLKGFRSLLRGVGNINFFLFRVEKLFA